MHGLIQSLCKEFDYVKITYIRVALELVYTIMLD
jgi:hypothetical protein